MLAFNTYNQSIVDLSGICLIFMGVALGVFLIGIVVKNFLLRIVLKKKSEILEVFF